MLNDFFASLFTVESMGHIPMPQPLISGGESKELSQIEVTRHEVPGKLKTEKSPGPDGIHSRVLKELRCEIVHLLTHICNATSH